MRATRNPSRKVVADDQILSQEDTDLAACHFPRNESHVPIGFAVPRSAIQLRGPAPAFVTRRGQPAAGCAQPLPGNTIARAVVELVEWHPLPLWNWGESPVGVPVNSEIGYRIWVSAELLLLATIISVVLGVAVGVYTASRQYKVGDRIWQAHLLRHRGLRPRCPRFLPEVG